MNDPNGPIFFGGRYHMFHQYNPQAAVWGNMNWAHATSPDMVHWQHQPIALSPSPGGPDRDGVFSGSAVLDNGKPTMIYTGVAPPVSDADATLRDGVHTWREAQCLAVAQDDNLRTWKKLPEPVIPAPPAGLAVTGFRDPYVWREGNHWMLILGSGIRGKGGAILLYRSPDLRDWTYLHPLVEGSAGTNKNVNPVDAGEMWECPDFFPLGGKHVLLISTMGKVRWKVGTYANQRFTPEKEGVVDWGAYYAAKTMLDADGNRILWGWITETRPDADLIDAGWAGAMSLPRVLSLNSNNELQTEVAPAVQQLRVAHTSIPGDATSVMREKILDTLRIHDLAAELKLELRPRPDEFSVHLQSEGGENFATISCANKSSSPELRVNSVAAPLRGAAQSPVQLHAFLDGSVLEVFVNGTMALTARIYQTPSGPLRLKLEGNAKPSSLDVWQMTPISKDRLTGSLCS
jgi:beta-fructofuranosidase